MDGGGFEEDGLCEVEGGEGYGGVAPGAAVDVAVSSNKGDCQLSRFLEKVHMRGLSVIWDKGRFVTLPSNLYLPPRGYFVG